MHANLDAGDTGLKSHKHPSPAQNDRVFVAGIQFVEVLRLVFLGIDDNRNAGGRYPGPSRLTPAQIADARASGVTAINLTVSRENYDRTIPTLAGSMTELDDHPETYLQVRSYADLLRAKREGKFGLIFGFQSADPIGEDLSLLETFHGLGVRIVQLTYNNGNRLGDRSLVADNCGLTPFGRQVVERLNELRIVVDLSHSGPQTSLEGLLASKRPPIISHTGDRAVYDHPRSQPDEILKACASKGGAVGLYLTPFLGLDPKFPTRQLLMRHIDHALKVCGEDHVGIGSDMSISPVLVDQNYMKLNVEDIASRKAKGIAAPLEEVPVLTPELNSPRRKELIAEGMAQRGHSARVIEKVIGPNFGRVFKEVWGA